VIFRPELARLVARGRKTMTRRLIGEPRRAVRRNGTAYMTSPWRPRVGREEPVQPGRGRLQIARVEITEVRREQLGLVTFEDACAEGFRTTADFKGYWVRLHDKAWVAKREPVDDQGDVVEALPADELAGRFDDRWGYVPVWVVRFELVGEQVIRLAHAAAPTVRYRTVNGRQVIDDKDRDLVDRGYTTSEQDALPDEPEVIDPGRLHPDWQQRSRAMAQAAASSEDATRLSGLTHPEERLRELRRMAIERGVDVSGDVRVIERRLDAIARKVDGGARRAA
jgi:hypothetical protein